MTTSTRQLTALVLLSLLLFSACGNHRRFDAARWRAANARERGLMAEDLVNRNDLIGRSADEVQRILGPANIDYGKALSYKIDLGWLFKDPQSYGLLVYLDQNRTVRELKIVD